PDHTHELWSATNAGDPTLSRSSSSDNGNLNIDNVQTVYGDPLGRPHALTQRANDYFLYDNNGQMGWTSTVGNVTWNLDHQLVNFGGVSYEYDADGARLKKTFSGVDTIYLGDDYEIEGN